jgi:hypothetical protein
VADSQVDSLITRALRLPGATDLAPPPDFESVMQGLESLAGPVYATGGPAPDDSDDGLPFLTPGPDGLGRLGPYRVVRRLGAGGMGVVFLAEDTGLHRFVALKVLRPGAARSGGARERFLREARAVAAIKHDHIVTVYQVGEAESAGGPVSYLAMELLEGASLFDWLRRNPRPPLAWVPRLGRQIADGLAAAHARGLIHRDVKPGNLWLEAPPGWRGHPDDPALGVTGRVKLLDFGLAFPAGEGAPPEGVVVGTPAYMAPEQLRGGTLDARCDLFGLGCVLYELCAGAPPFPRRARRPQPADPAEGPPRPLGPEVPPALADLIRRLLAADPAGRPASARVVEQELSAIEQAAAAPPAGPERLPDSAPGGRRRGRRALLWAVAALAVAALLPFLPRQPAADEAAALAAEGPPDDAWCRRVAGLAPEAQVAAVLAKLQALNPGFDGRSARVRIDEGSVVEFRFLTDDVTDVRPVRALTGLHALGCTGSAPGKGRLTDLSPLAGLQLQWLFCWKNPSLKDFHAVRDMPLVQFEAGDTGLDTLKDLEGKPIQVLTLPRTAVRDLTPVRTMPDLAVLVCNGCPVTSLEPLLGTNLRELVCDFRPERDEAVMRRLPGLEKINHSPAKDFWRQRSTSD